MPWGRAGGVAVAGMLVAGCGMAVPLPVADETEPPPTPTMLSLIVQNRADAPIVVAVDLVGGAHASYALAAGEEGMVIHPRTSLPIGARLRVLDPACAEIDSQMITLMLNTRLRVESLGEPVAIAVLEQTGAPAEVPRLAPLTPGCP